MSLERRAWDFFLAHAGADKRTAERLYDYLHPHARVFLDSRCIQLGDDWDVELAAAQENSLITVVLVSATTGQAYYQREEIAAAIALARQDSQRHRVVPVFVGRVNLDGVPYGLRLKHGLTVSDKLSLREVSNQLLRLLSSVNSGDGPDSSHRHRQDNRDADTPADVLLHVSTLNQADPAAAFRKRGNTELEYSAERVDGVIRILPVMGYLSEYEKGGLIEPIRYNYVPFYWDFPNLDLKIVNNGDRTIFLTEAVFDVEESRVDPFPVLVVRPDTYRYNALHFLLQNEGWGEARNLVARFHLIPLGREELKPGAGAPYPYEVIVGDLSDQHNVDISDTFRRAGVDFAGLKALGTPWTWVVMGSPFAMAPATTSG